jgi:large subunit ribosomal protein L29
MKASEVRVMSTDQIREELETARENLFNLRFQWATAQIRDHNLMKAARRDIARLETVLRAREAADAHTSAWGVEGPALGADAMSGVEGE